MKHAILMTAYKCPELINLTLDRYAEDFDFFIHIDKKSDMKESELHSYPSVCVVKKHKVNWGGGNHIRAFVDLMKLAVNTKHYDFFHLITGQDIIVAPKSAFSLLKQGHSYMSYGKPEVLWNNQVIDARYSYYRNLDCFNVKNIRMSKIEDLIYRIQRKLGLRRSSLSSTMWGGDTYCSLAKEAVCYILNNGDQLFERLKSTYIPEEVFFQTCLLNSPLKNTIINDRKRLIIWPGPKILSIEDFEEVTSGKYLFARKADIEQSMELLKRVYGIKGSAGARDMEL